MTEMIAVNPPHNESEASGPAMRNDRYGRGRSVKSSFSPEMEAQAMARPSRCRRICTEPAYDSFVPEGISCGEQVILTVDEYEVIRMIDLEKLTHEQCARQMGISRTTVTEIYERARLKIADCLISGKALRISRGNYKLCDGSAWKCFGKKCNRINNMSEHQTAMRKQFGK